jgi:hypothetical protein
MPQPSQTHNVDNDGNVLVSQGAYAGSERNPGSVNNGYQAVLPLGTITRPPNNTSANALGTILEPVALISIRITANLAGNVTVVGFTDMAGAAFSLVWTTPTAGELLSPWPLFAPGGITVALSNAADHDKTWITYANLAA